MNDKAVRRKKSRRDPNYKKRKAITIAAAILGVAAVFVVLVLCVLLYYVRKMNYIPLNPDYTIASELESETQGPTGVVETVHANSKEEDVAAYQKAAQDALAQIGASLEDARLDNVYNVLLVGTDNRIVGWSGRSDTVMLLSINFQTRQITLTSFLRDLYVYIPEVDQYNKLNAAYQYGGMELLVETIQYNFSIEVNRYIAVDFFTFMDVVHVMGGLDVDVKSEELYWLNEYIHANNLLLGCYEYEDYLEEDEVDGSFIHLNGKQVLAYSRFRYVGNGDFSRTERQRKVLNLAYNKLKHLNPEQMINMLETILPQITTNIEETEALGLIARVPEMSTFTVVNWSIPDDQYTYITIDTQSHLGIDFKYYVTRLYNLIYGNVVLEQ